MIILLGGEKGGSGKTTLTVNIAAMRTMAGYDTLLVDTDKQSTASYWCSLREEKNILPRISSIQKYDRSARTEVIELAKKFPEIIIDAGGRDSPELRAGLLVCDIAIFPLRPSQFDLWTVSRLEQLVDTAKEYNTNLKAFIVINQASPNPRIKEVEAVHEFIRDIRGIDVMNTVICERIVFRKAALLGMSVIETKLDNKAITEMNNLYQEIYG